MHRPIVRWTRLFSRFAQIESAGGIVLLACTVVAMVWVNSSAADFYASLLHVPITIGFNHLYLSEDLRYWINDGLMAVFFLLVGLEIKHEMLVGELSSFKLAALPVFAAIGGIIFPACIYARFGAAHLPEGVSWNICTRQAGSAASASPCRFLSPRLR